MTTTPIFPSFFEVGIIIFICLILTTIAVILQKKKEERDKEWREEKTKEWIDGEKDNFCECGNILKDDEEICEDCK